MQIGNPVVALHPAVPPATTSRRRQIYPVDRAGYVAITPVDPYQGDRNAIHVVMAAGQQLTRGYLRVHPEKLPRRTQSSPALRLTAPVVIGSPIGGANLTLAEPIVEACVTTAAVPASLTTANAPAYDCSKGSSVGKAIDGGAEWAFPLRPLLAYWKRTTTPASPLSRSRPRRRDLECRVRHSWHGGDGHPPDRGDVGHPAILGDPPQRRATARY